MLIFTNITRTECEIKHGISTHTSSPSQVRLQTALNQPQVSTRCEEVARILSEATTKDAGYILRTTVEHILGLATPSTIQGHAGWGLRVITRSAQPREFEQLRVFLGPNGPLLALIFRLASDPYMVFEFPVAWLPVRISTIGINGITCLFMCCDVRIPLCFLLSYTLSLHAPVHLLSQLPSHSRV